MPELPEVETTRAGLKDRIVGQRLVGWTLRTPALRWPIEFPDHLRGERLVALNRRGKYLLFEFSTGTLLVHLGMSGSLRLLTAPENPLRHDHVDLDFGTARVRLNDPRRFGCVLWHSGGAPPHPLLAHLGVEPLGGDLSGRYLKEKARNRKVAVKNFIMDSRVLVGVGNIYAAEALFLAGVRPSVAAGRLTLVAWTKLAAAIKQVLARAVAVGGTTLRDFVNSDGKPGYFKQQLNVYGRAGAPCRRCGAALRNQRLGGRATVYCPSCQRRWGWPAA